MVGDVEHHHHQYKEKEGDGPYKEKESSVYEDGYDDNHKEDTERDYEDKLHYNDNNNGNKEEKVDGFN
eukprot:83333-Ditylum_brightwellii.AAC.1